MIDWLLSKLVALGDWAVDKLYDRAEKKRFMPVVRDNTPEEDVRIRKAALSDPDNPPVEAERLEQMKRKHRR